MHVGTDFLKLPPVTGQYWSLFQCSVLGTGGTCVPFGAGFGAGLAAGCAALVLVTHPNLPLMVIGMGSKHDQKGPVRMLL